MRDPEFKDNLELSLRLDGGGAKPRSNVWKRLSRVMEVVIYVLLILTVVKLFGPEMERQNELKVEKERIAHIRDEKEARVLRLRQEHRLLKTDKGYLETVARDRLNLQREGEHIVRIDRGEE
jgi:cell division protein FtsB